MINFFLVPLYLEKFQDASRYGVLTEYMSYTAFLLVFLTFGMETSYFRFAGKELEEPKAFSQLFTNVFVLGFLGCGVIFLLSGPISVFLQESGNIFYVKVLALIIFLDVVFSVSFARLRYLNKGGYFATVKLITILLNVGLNLLFIVYLPNVYGYSKLDWGLFSVDLSDQVFLVLLANLIANSVFVLFFFKDLSFLFKNYDWSVFKKVFNYSYPVMILGLAGIVNELIDRLMLKDLIPVGFYGNGTSNLSAIGVYAANYKFAIFITLAIQAYRYAAEPFFFKKADDRDSKATFALLMDVFVVLLLLAALSISVFKEEVGEVLLRKPIYREGLYVVPILLLANVCMGVYYNLSAWYKLTDKTIFGTVLGVTGALVTVFLNWLLIPLYGYLGSAIATFACYFSMMLACYLLGKKYYPVPYNVTKLAFYFVVVIGFVLVSHFLINDILFDWVYKILLVIVFLLIYWSIDGKKQFKK